MSFGGFDVSAVATLDAMPGWDADIYADHKARLTAGLVAPAKALISHVADALDADLTVVPRSSVSPLHRDLRFASAGAPRYEDHLLLTTWQGVDKRTSPTLWIRIGAADTGFASGIGFTPEIRDRWRDAVAGDAGVELAAELDRLRSSLDAEVAGDELVRVPAPHAPDHPRAHLLRRTGFQVRHVVPHPSALGEPGFADWCVARLEQLMSVHRWLVRELAVPSTDQARSATSATRAHPTPEETT